jgi:ABC-type bacteriocin/lantibiotic exporter with double-glycine peptidase domain
MLVVVVVVVVVVAVVSYLISRSRGRNMRVTEKKIQVERSVPMAT